MWGYGNMMGWGGGGFGMIIWFVILIAIVAGIIWLLRSGGGHVTAKRYEELNSRFAFVDRSKLSSLLTNVEKRTIERLYMENQNVTDDAQVLAFYTINAPHRKKLTFEAWIGDNGESDNLKTPYDERDGAFSDLSDDLIVEDRRPA